MRDIPVGNGSLLVTFDEYYQIRDVYFPHVGKENHTEGHACRFGVWTENSFSWTDGASWQRSLRYLSETLVTDVRLINDPLGVEIISNDTVLSHTNLFLRRVRVKNTAAEQREIRLFLHHDFYISETEVGDTAFFDPESFSIVHYKANRYFLINTEPRFDQFATGRKGLPGREGTWRDAEDGFLAGGAITEGAVDSTIGLSFDLQPAQTAEFYYWIAAGESHAEVNKLNKLIHDNSPRGLFVETENYWRAWVNKNEIDFSDLSAKIVQLFKRSLLVMRTQIDNGGAILAANDSDVTLRATDHYSYLWTRDGALVAYALDLAGYSFLTRKFFALCGEIIHKNGYFLQKYNADGSLASGWHAAWDARKQEKLVPIQEDETALVLWALWQHYDRFRDIEFVRRLYYDLIVRAADFMTKFRDETTKLPSPSWNLWEDRRGIHTFTCGAVVGGLEAAANFARLFGEETRADTYQTAADEVRVAMREHLYSPSLKRFVRSLMPTDNDENGGFYADTALDSSLWGAFYFGAFEARDELMRSTMQAIEDGLWAKTEIGGVARYESDGYMTISTDHSKIPGNPWFISTLWLADYYIAAAKTKDDLNKALNILEWTAERALPSGVLAEQVNPLDGSPVSVSPLTWSHSSFVATTMSYLLKLAEFDSSYYPNRRAKLV
ncbi:MAG: glycoside hydrolase family 15 protein [Pyrinomonadaceae bacterium]